MTIFELFPKSHSHSLASFAMYDNKTTRGCKRTRDLVYGKPKITWSRSTPKRKFKVLICHLNITFLNPNPDVSTN